MAFVTVAGWLLRGGVLVRSVVSGIGALGAGLAGCRCRLLRAIFIKPLEPRRNLWNIRNGIKEIADEGVNLP